MTQRVLMEFSRHWNFDMVEFHLRDNSENIQDMDDISATCQNLLENPERNYCKRYI